MRVIDTVITGNEVARIHDVHCQPSYTTPCLRCGRAIELYFNGGELDSGDCCGLEYNLESDVVDVVVRKRERT